MRTKNGRRLRRVLAPLTAVSLGVAGVAGSATLANAAEEPAGDTVMSGESAVDTQDSAGDGVDVDANEGEVPTAVTQDAVGEDGTPITPASVTAHVTDTAEPVPAAILSGTWGQAAWTFDETTGVLTVTGSENPADPFVLGIWSESPWQRSFGITPVAWGDMKKIVLENPTGIALPANSANLFSVSTAWFGGLNNVTEIVGIEDVQTGSVTNMHKIFGGIGTPTLDLSNWDVSNVQTMSMLFYTSGGLQTVDVSGWDVENVTNMSQMFGSAYNLTSVIGLETWNTENVENMSGMFAGAAALDSLDDISGWNTSSATDMNYMFASASALTSLDLSAWSLSSVTEMNNMFSGTTSLETLDVSSWDTSAATNMEKMFKDAPALTSLDLSSWDTSAVTKMTDMLAGTLSLSTLSLGTNSKLAEDAGLPDVPSGADADTTGLWAQIAPEATEDAAWATYTSDELLAHSQEIDETQTFVWQQKAAVTFDLDGGEWPGGAVPAEVTALAASGVGNLVDLGVLVNPVREDVDPTHYRYEFLGWDIQEPAGAEGRAKGMSLSYVLTGPSFVLTAPGTWTATALWDTYVTPMEPTVIPSEECGVDATVEIPVMEGVTYSQQKDGTIVTVTAEAAPGYVLETNVQTRWELDVAGEACPAAELTIQFDLNGGQGTFEEITFVEGESVTVPQTVPTRVGYDFKGWSVVSISRATQVVQPGEVLTPTSSLLLVAQWEEKAVTPPVTPGGSTGTGKLPQTGADNLGGLLLGATAPLASGLGVAVQARRRFAH